MFEHVWRQMNKKFYQPEMHGVDWKAYKKDYAEFLPHIDNNWDFAEMLSEMLGELNASHTGSRYRARAEGADATATLGCFYDPEHRGKGLKILEIMDRSPLAKDGSKIEVGTVIEKIDGVEIAAGANFYPLLNHKAGEHVLLSLRDAKGKETWEEVVKPIGRRAQQRLLYERWIKSRRAETERLSKGRLGYVHVPTMADGFFRDAYTEIMGRYVDKEGVVVDTRFNNGGNLTEDLANFLDGEAFATNVPRGQMIGTEGGKRWNRPSIVIQNEANYSDAHYFPWAYKELGVGQLVGMPVPGTATAVWWETLLDRTIYFGIPQVGVVDRRGNYLENLQLEPDHLVNNDPESVAKGRDLQLEKAVEVLLGEIDGK